MHNQNIFNTNLRRFSAAHFQQTDLIPDLERNEQKFLVMMCYCHDGAGFIRQLPKPKELWGWTVTDFLDSGGYALSVVALIYRGLVRRIDDKWCIIADPDGSALTIPVPENADLGLVPSISPSDRIVSNVQRYVETHRHSRMSFKVWFAGSRSSDSPG